MMIWMIFFEDIERGGKYWILVTYVTGTITFYKEISKNYKKMD